MAWQIGKLATRTRARGGKTGINKHGFKCCRAPELLGSGVARKVGRRRRRGTNGGHGAGK